MKSVCKHNEEKEAPAIVKKFRILLREINFSHELSKISPEAQDLVNELIDSYLKMLGEKKTGYHSIWAQNAELQREVTELKKASLLDRLTGAMNRAGSENQLDLIVGLLKRGESKDPFTIINIDIDNFKGINDVYGHSVGDVILRTFVDRACACLKRETDLLARVGGDEFLIILPSTDKSGAREILDKIHMSLRSPVNISAQNHSMKSIFFEITGGIIEMTSSIPNKKRLLELADQEMYRLKRLKKRCA